jgi:hypothetical protein
MWSATKCENKERYKKRYIGENIKMKLILGCTSASVSEKIICVIWTNFLPSRVDLGYKATKEIFLWRYKRRLF